MYENHTNLKSDDRPKGETDRLRPFKDQEPRMNQMHKDLLVKQDQSEKAITKADIYRKLLDDGLEANGYALEKEAAND
ncbi:hypothetical protein [Roseivirga seohaensis]|uniref:hypothetical protein n=1 Tax=Roseivirga seohaensis TaxID=1914963 RepID=UPI003BAB0029